MRRKPIIKKDSEIRGDRIDKNVKTIINTTRKRK